MGMLARGLTTWNLFQGAKSGIFTSSHSSDRERGGVGSATSAYDSGQEISHSEAHMSQASHMEAADDWNA